MTEAISVPREQMSPYAPKMVRIQIPVEKIGAVIGPGGRVIRSIIEETGASIDVSDDGGVTIGSSDQRMLDLARSKIDGLTRELVVGDILTGKIARVTNFGSFVELLPGKDGLLRNEEVGDMEGEPQIGQEITVVIKEIDSMGRINLSRKALFGNDEDSQNTQSSDRTEVPNRDQSRPRSTGGPSGGKGRFNDRDRGRRFGPGSPSNPSGPRGNPNTDRRFTGGEGPSPS